jgi:hypothetical protein
MSEPASLDINLDGLKHGWDKTGRLANVCAHCGERIRIEAEDETEVPLQIFRGEGQKTEMLSFHWDCAARRMTPPKVKSFAE